MVTVETIAVELEQKLKGTQYTPPPPPPPPKRSLTCSHKLVSEGKPQAPMNDRVPEEEGSGDEEEDLGVTGGATGWFTKAYPMYCRTS